MDEYADIMRGDLDHGGGRVVTLDGLYGKHIVLGLGQRGVCLIVVSGDSLGPCLWVPVCGAMSVLVSSPLVFFG